MSFTQSPVVKTMGFLKWVGLEKKRATPAATAKRSVRSKRSMPPVSTHKPMTPQTRALLKKAHTRFTKEVLLTFPLQCAPILLKVANTKEELKYVKAEDILELRLGNDFRVTCAGCRLLVRSFEKQNAVDFKCKPKARVWRNVGSSSSFQCKEPELFRARAQKEDLIRVITEIKLGRYMLAILDVVAACEELPFLHESDLQDRAFKGLTAAGRRLIIDTIHAHVSSEYDKAEHGVYELYPIMEQEEDVVAPTPTPTVPIMLSSVIPRSGQLVSSSSVPSSTSPVSVSVSL